GALERLCRVRTARQAVPAVLLASYPQMRGMHVLCGPANNGGDGYVLARLLHETGASVSLWASGAPRSGSDAAKAAAECPLRALSLADFAPMPGELVVDALYGAGLSRALSGMDAQ